MVDNNTENMKIGVTMKIKCFIDAGLQNQISRASLETILEEIASTQSGSEEVIRGLLDILYTKHENEPQSKCKSILKCKEPETQDINLDDIEVTDDTPDYIEIMNENENMLGETIMVEDEISEKTGLDQFDNKISSIENNDLN